MAAVTFATAQAQEITSYEADSTSIYNALNNPNDFSQAPTVLPKQRIFAPGRVNTNVMMGTSVSNLGASQYVSPTINYNATDRLQLFFGMGIMHTNLRLDLSGTDLSAPKRDNTSLLTTYYTVGARYQVSPRCDVYGSVIYMNNSLGNNANPLFDKDRYMATFGATFNITESLSIGVEVRNSKNVSPYYMHNPFSPYAGF